MKKLLATLLMGVALMGAALPAWAADTAGTVTMEAKGDQAAVSLSLPDQADQSATALQLTFQVEGGDAKAEFLFDKGLTCSVQEYRYEESSGQLTVYLAGDKPLFQNGSAKLGTIQLKANKGASATVRVVEDSLELVNAAYGKTETTSAAGGEVTLTVAGTSSIPKPEQTTAPDSGQSGGSQSQNTTQSGNAAAQPTATAQPTPGKQETGSSTAATATPAPSAQPSQEPEGTSVPDQTEAPQPTAATPEAEPDQTKKSGPNPLLLLGGGAAVIVIAGAVIFFKKP